MAKFTTVGFDDVEAALLRREAAALEAVPEMLEAGAAVLIKAQQDEIEAMQIVDFRDMKNSIKATKIKGSDAERYVEVYPQGEDRKGVSNAEKAFIAQNGRMYGKTKKEARPWFSSANEKCASSVHEAMRKVWEAKQNG